MTTAIQNWHRQYRVVFGSPSYTSYIYKINATGISKVGSNTSDFDGTTIPSNAKSMSNVEGADDYIGYQFKFSIESRRSMGTNSTSQEKTTVNLYNLDTDAADVLCNNGTVIRVYAGYDGGDLYLAYSGDIIRVVPHYQGSDLVYSITCKDGATDAKNTRATLDYAESMSETDVIKDIISKMPFATTGVIATSDYDDEYLTGGHSFQGHLEHIFNELIANKGLIYGRFNGKISVVPYRLSTSDDDYETLSENNYNLTEDLIKSIGPQNKTSNTPATSNSEPQNVVVNTFFLPFDFGSMFTVPTSTTSTLVNKYAGSYNIIGHSLKLDSYGKEWDVTLLGSPIT